MIPPCMHSCARDLITLHEHAAMQFHAKGNKAEAQKRIDLAQMWRESMGEKEHEVVSND